MSEINEELLSFWKYYALGVFNCSVVTFKLFSLMLDTLCEEMVNGTPACFRLG